MTFMEREFCLIYSSTELIDAENYIVMYLKKILQDSALDLGLILSIHKINSPLAVKFNELAYSKQLLHTAFDSYWISFRINS